VTKPIELIPGAKVETNLEEFEDILSEGKPLRIKYGIDPTSRHVHFGHTVPLRLLRRFQDAGHDIHLIIGDMTAAIGDPSGRNDGRPMLTQENIQINMEMYLDQIGLFIDLDKTTIHYNSTWLARLGVMEIVREFSHITVQRMTDRKDFAQRIENQTPVYLHEFLYPIFQAIDSREIGADVEIGGTEQLYTLLLARTVQERAGQRPQTCITVPILRGVDGIKRMGKSLGNFVGVTESPGSIFGKTMSIPDELLDEWFKLLSDEPPQKESPRDRKIQLGTYLASICHGRDAADHARVEWIKQFSDKCDPDDIPEVSIPFPSSGTMEICPLMVATGLAQSLSDARRQIVPHSGVTVGPYRWRVEDPKTLIVLQDGMVIRKGKRNFVRLKFAKP
jgi:tyrosyl-tRNA synthetase